MNPPHSREAEEALVGAVLINPAGRQGINLVPDDFYIHRNGWIWGAILSLEKQGLPIDIVTVAEELDKQGHLADIGGAAYITKLLNNVPSSLHAKAYADRVKETAVRRQGILGANNFASKMYDESQSVQTSIQEHIETVGDLRLGTTGRMKSAADVHLDFAEYVYSENIALPYNIGAVDKWMGGKEKGTLIVLCSRPRVGKSAFMMQAACADAKNKYRVGIFELEMTAAGLWQRRACPRAGISWKKVRSGEVTAEERQKLTDTSIELSMEYETLFIDDTPALTTDDIYLKTLENKLDIIYIDHLSLLGDKGEVERLRLGNMSMALKNIAKKLNIPVVLLTQLNRNLETRKDKRPQLHDLRESGEIEQNADEVLGLYRDSLYTRDENDDTAELWVRKFRNGDGNAVIKLRFDADQQWFSEGGVFDAEVRDVDMPGWVHD